MASLVEARYVGKPAIDDMTVHATHLLIERWPEVSHP